MSVEDILLPGSLVLFTTAWGIALFILLMAWSIVWKGLALWKSARNKDLAWFVVILLVNTLGILEIIYIFFVQKKKKKR